MIWDRIIGQTEVVAQLRVAVDKGTVSHAFLFWGPPGAGKKRAAKILAAALNCPKRGCGSCIDCQKIFEEIHPDVYQISPEGSTITIDQIRFLQDLTNLKLSEGRAKVFILEEVDCMRREAANAFLKTLEEPPPSTFFILIASQLDDMLPTIISRCQNIRFRPISMDQIKSLMVKEKGIEDKEAELISKISGGIVERAFSLVESEEAKGQRELLLSILYGLNQVNIVKLLDSATLLISKIRDPLSSIKERQEEELKEALEFAVSSPHATYIKKRYTMLHKRELSRREQNVLNEIFSYCSSWYADILLLKQGLEEKFVQNIDYLEILRKRSNFLKEESVLEALDIISHIREMVQRNVNPQLALETMLIQLQNLEL